MLNLGHRIIGHTFMRISRTGPAYLPIDTIELIGGELPAKEMRLVMAWAEIHKEELLDNWSALQRGRLPSKIEPLR